MKTIMIFLSPVVSHFLPTIQLTNHLQERNIRVIYVGFPKISTVVKSYGYEFIEINSVKLSDINKNYESWNFIEHAKCYKKINDEIFKIIKENKTDLCLYDISRFNMFFLPIYSSNIPMLSFWTCSGADDINTRVPPNSSTIIPTNTFINRVRVLFQWIKRYIKKEFNIKRIVSKCFFPYPDIRKIARKDNLVWKYNIDSPYIENEKIIFGPSAFEFNSRGINGNYLGLSIADSRETDNFEFDYDWINSQKKLIYCSLGTMCKRYSYSIKFFNEVIKMADNQDKWQFIINIGDVSRDKLIDIIDTKKILLVKDVPQLEILARSNVVLSHGGYGTIKECIKYEVPIIVFPCTYDQPGNASRVDHHKIGKKFKIRKVNSKRIENLITDVINNYEFYINNIKLMKEKINKCDNVHKCYDKICSLLSKNNENVN